VGIGEFFHLIHIVDDEDEVDAFYGELFATQPFRAKHFLESEKRWASLSMAADLMIEVIEPSGDPADSHMPLTKFRNRHGQHFHSFAWYVDVADVRPLFDRLRASGVRVAKPGGGFFPDGDIDPGNTIFTHPKDTFGQIEFEGKHELWQKSDPRFQPEWSMKSWREGPLGIVRLSHMTTVVERLEPAVRFYSDVLEGRVFHHDATDEVDRALVLVGTDTVIEVACPRRSDSDLAVDLAEHGQLPHSATFRVDDLSAVERHVEKMGIRIADRSGSVLLLDPADCFGARWAFIADDLPGDPRPPATP
jgi:extradiol dioxygenase family protein